MRCVHEGGQCLDWCNTLWDWSSEHLDRLACGIEVVDFTALTNTRKPSQTKQSLKDQIKNLISNMADILPAQVDRTLESNEAVIIALAICIMDEAKGSPEEIDRIFDELPHHPENQSTDPPENVQ
ncbi:hypothetical protein PSHT_03376 [Puccinia striiformis]|uniref:Uncharacterized protein n=2 Tax=Puccinia striiformis TaxID=27350 RepID=A0A2S4WFM6_9BASI|nr:hypothetical protein PSHT_03376 [Puccinia striiformis]